MMNLLQPPLMHPRKHGDGKGINVPRIHPCMQLADNHYVPTCVGSIQVQDNSDE